MKKNKKFLTLVVALILSASLIVPFLVVHAGNDYQTGYEVDEATYAYNVNYEQTGHGLVPSEIRVHGTPPNWTFKEDGSVEVVWAGGFVQHFEEGVFTEVVCRDGLRHLMAVELIEMTMGDSDLSVEEFFSRIKFVYMPVEEPDESEYRYIIRTKVYFYPGVEFEDLEILVLKIRVCDVTGEEFEVDIDFETDLESLLGLDFLKDHLLEHFVLFQERMMSLEHLCMEVFGVHGCSKAVPVFREFIKRTGAGWFWCWWESRMYDMRCPVCDRWRGERRVDDHQPHNKQYIQPMHRESFWMCTLCGFDLF